MPSEIRLDQLVLSGLLQRGQLSYSCWLPSFQI